MTTPGEVAAPVVDRRRTIYLCFLAATLGKGVGCWLAALASKEPNREAMAIGSLMNARGLMELILLNIALEQGIITPTLFTMLVLMAVVTTLIASPIFELVYGRHRRKDFFAKHADDLSPAPMEQKV